ncbi:MAG: fumarylacetoacetate hydrolase family protein [Phycisphaerae bacterium]|nr:fumarylacetoacetate hydrolase family protein [Gemmatimonadaceae bacterium]
MLRPSKIVCVGRNYRAHAAEMGSDVPKEPLLFLKPPSAIIREGEAIKLHKVSTHIEFEGEIGLVLGHRISHASEEEAMTALTHLVALNDVTARDLQKSDGQWARAKGMDTFLPLGKPAPVPDDLDNVTLITRVNGEERQRALASDMVFAIPFLLSYISQFITLEAGDIVATGTPAGTRQIFAGDVVEVELVGLSRVTNPVVAGD